ncbi:U-myrmeciitoxin(01)-Mg4b [Dirofilaria immitis]
MSHPVCFQRLSGAYPKTFLPCFILGMLILVVTSRIIPDQNLSSLQGLETQGYMPFYNRWQIIANAINHRNRSRPDLPYRVDAYRMRRLLRNSSREGTM